MVTIQFYGPAVAGIPVQAKVRHVAGEGVQISDKNGAIVIADADRIRLEDLAATLEAANRNNDKEYYGAYDKLDIEAQRAARNYYGAK